MEVEPRGETNGVAAVCFCRILFWDFSSEPTLGHKHQQTAEAQCPETVSGIIHLQSSCFTAALLLCAPSAHVFLFSIQRLHLLGEEADHLSLEEK